MGPLDCATHAPAARFNPSLAQNDTVGVVLAQLGIELPVVQAGMGGGLAGSELAGAVSAAGGLGTIGILAPDGLRSELSAGRAITDRPIAVNLLLPFARRAHFGAGAGAGGVLTVWGRARRPAAKVVIHQCG